MEDIDITSKIRDSLFEKLSEDSKEIFEEIEEVLKEDLVMYNLTIIDTLKIWITNENSFKQFLNRNKKFAEPIEWVDDLIEEIKEEKLLTKLHDSKMIFSTNVKKVLAIDSYVDPQTFWDN